MEVGFANELDVACERSQARLQTLDLSLWRSGVEKRKTVGMNLERRLEAQFLTSNI